MTWRDEEEEAGFNNPHPEKKKKAKSRQADGKGSFRRVEEGWGGNIQHQLLPMTLQILLPNCGSFVFQSSSSRDRRHHQVTDLELVLFTGAQNGYVNCLNTLSWFPLFIFFTLVKASVEM